MVLFSVAAFIIALRETMEAALIISIILAYLAKTGNQKYKKEVWVGVILAFIASIITAIIFQVTIGGFEGRSEKLFEGFAFTITAFLISWMIIWMFKQGKYMSLTLHKKVDEALDGNRYSIFFLSFFNVFREGVETVLFFTGIIGEDSPMVIFLSGMAGIILTIIISLFLFTGTMKLDLNQFFNITSVLLILFAAGLFSRGMHEFQEIGIFGDENAFLNIVFLDLSGVLNDKTNTIGVLLRALFGYQDKPSFLELFSYSIYWVFISLFFIKINKTETINAISA